MKEEKHKPEFWEKHFGVKIYDADGWNRSGKLKDPRPKWGKPLTESEFLGCLGFSTAFYSKHFFEKASERF